MKDRVFRILKVVFFLFCMYLILNGQRTVGHWELFTQLIGLLGLLLLLWNYNRKFT